MSDGTSADIFDAIFSACAKEGDVGKRIARKVWRTTSDYDFHPACLDEKPLVALGLARVTEIDGEQVLQFRSSDLRRWEDL